MATEYELGLLVGFLVGEGHFGGDGRQPQITLRMHVRHEALFSWLVTTFPGGRLYGPYDHSGRRYYQWMARGPFLRDELVPLIESRITPELDGHAYLRFVEMRRRYATQLIRREQDPRVPATAHPDVYGSTSGPESPTLAADERDDGQPSRGDAAAQPELSALPDANARSGPSAESTLSKAESIFARMRDPGIT